MAITEKDVNDLLKVIEVDCKEARLKRAELSRLKKHLHSDTVEEAITDNKNLKVETSSNISLEDDDFNDEISFYLDSYKKLDDQFTYEDIINVLPTKDNYNYIDIINRLIAESYKEIKEINELLMEDDSIPKEELVEYKALIGKEKLKIKYLRKSMLEEEQTTIMEHKNRIVLVPTINGNIRIIDELEHIPSEYYDSFLELINSIINGTFKNVKTFTSNPQLTGVSEVKGFKTRVVFSRLDKNTYGLITAFVKKTDTDKLYKETLTRKVTHFRENESKLKERIKDSEFMELNDLYIEELFNLISPKETGIELKKVNNHD
ncbi:MAG: hypothetical protein IJI58_05135 [Bacilli bacterium]|nr:hypothetical protein [Bacilli bacterium]